MYKKEVNYLQQLWLQLVTFLSWIDDIDDLRPRRVGETFFFLAVHIRGYSKKITVSRSIMENLNF